MLEYKVRQIDNFCLTMTFLSVKTILMEHCTAYHQ